jgi:UDP-N-acetylglucosamine--N-acetylmuramyl-(pentapeptide) pyrophosphoryl-undecaprenol N-acetylglucosamine transferase
MHDHPLFHSVHTVRAGKFRRYHGEGLKQLLDVKTLALNIRDFFYVGVGFVQSYKLLRSIKPAVVFSRGGFVSVPVCLAAAARHIPYLTHDSDAIPSLANRIIARWASLHAVALPKEVYSYPQEKTLTVGVPVAARFKKVTPEIHYAAKSQLGIPKTAPTILIIGGGLGAERVNNALTAGAKQLFKEMPQLHVLHVAGRASEHSVRAAYDALGAYAKQVHTFGFTSEVALLGEAADVVVTRAGATNLAEFSLQGKACIIVPNPQLTGGHQLKNAIAFRDKNAAVVVAEDHLDELPGMIIKLLHDSSKRQLLSESILEFGNRDASKSLAMAVLTLMQKS